jgi:predicted phosphodiesterase
MSSWEAIEGQTHLDSISVTVTKAIHHNNEKLNWRLTVEDTSGKQFKLEIWNKHDPLTEWKEGAEYVIRNGYGQTWDNGQKKKLHSSGKWSVDRVDSAFDCRLMVMGDTHVGRKEHPSKPYQSIDCAGKFAQAIEVAVSHDADSILHTGDVFHDYATEEDCETVDTAFERMRDTDIKFYYILGNHECDRGTRLLQRWEQRGVATHLDMSGSEVTDDVKVYGYDHRPGSKFSVEEMDVPTLLMNSVSILVLHQTLVPFRSGADVDLDEINSKPFGGFDYVVSGHLHDPERPNWDDGEFLYAGSTEDISTNSDASDPSVWFLTVEGEVVDTLRRKL